MKKLLSGITAMVLVLGLFTTGVQAAGLSSQEIKLMVEQTNKEIYVEIDKADDKADELVLSYEAANISYEQLNENLDKIIEELLKVTDKKMNKLIEEVGKDGYVLEKAWIPVEVGNRIVLIDPCISDGV
jgi:hypothetical protein